MNPLTSILCLAGSLFALGTNVSANPSAESATDQQVRLQVFLDRANFGPGKIDGTDGEFTRKALALYRQSQGLTSPEAGKTATAATKTPPDTAGLNLASVEPLYIPYQVTKEDLANVGELPEDHAAQAKLKSMPYRNALEAIAEKFHSDPKFLKTLNPQIKGDNLKEGDTISVPNVEPFELSQVKQIKPGEDLEPAETVSDSTEEDAAPEGKGSKEAKADTKSKPASGSAGDEASAISIDISTQDKMLVVKDGEKIKAAFPVTPGSAQIPSPIGHWKIERIAKMPNFRWDEKMLKEGERSSHFHLLPPGPNNPVGVMWIALNKKGIGIHGTEDPDSIGRAASHGCIRLANWDVVKLARMVKPGVPVTIQ